MLMRLNGKGVKGCKVLYFLAFLIWKCVVRRIIWYNKSIKKELFIHILEREVLDMLYIGKDVQDRMNLLGLTVDEVADKAFMEKQEVNAILQDEIALEDIDEFDLALISSVLHCRPEFFSDASVKEKDLLCAAMNRGNDNEKSLKVKAKIQDFLNDFAFVKDVLTEDE